MRCLFRLKFLASLLFALFSVTVGAQVQIVDPEPKAYVSGSYEVLVQASNQDQIQKTELVVDGNVVLTVDGWVPGLTYDFGEAVLAHQIYVQVTDQSGNVRVSPTVRTSRLEINVAASSEVILLTAVVKTAQNDALTGLDKDAFTVLENGKSLTLTTFFNERLPLDLVFCIDTSSSLRVKGIETVKAATIAFIQALEPSDRLNLYEFKTEPMKIFDFTTDHKRVLGHLQGLDARGETALFDTVLLGLGDLQQRVRGRKALILFTDGRDSVYEEPEDKARLMRKAITLAQNQEVSIFTIGLGKTVHQEALERMALETGGRFHYAEGADDLPHVFTELVTDLKHQYVIGAVPQATVSGFQKIEIRVKKRGAIVYSRKGYTRP